MFWIQDNVGDWFKAVEVDGGWETDKGEFIEKEFVIFVCNERV